jgi:hypothetical protein
MSLKLNSSGGGSVTLQEPSTASNVTLTLPATAGTIQVSGAAISGTTGTFTGLLDISAATAGQIRFPATQNASSNANTLDDYEEGTFNVGLTPGSGSITLFGGGNGNGGRYVKIGRLVFITIWVRVNSVSSPSGSLTLTGLPFAPIDDGVEARSAILCTGYNWNTGRTDLGALTMACNSGTTSVQFSNFAVTSWSSQTTPQASWVQSGTEIYINGCYTTQ